LLGPQVQLTNRGLRSKPSQMRHDRRHQIVECPARRVLPNSRHLPFAIVPIDLGHDLRGVIALAAEIEAGDFLVVAIIDNAAERILNLAEVLPGEAVYDENQRLGLGWHIRQIDNNLLVVPLPRAGPVVAGMDDAAIGAG